MKVFQVKGIIQYLLYIGLKHIPLSDLELEAEDQPTEQQNDIDPFPQTRNIVLENHLSIFIHPRLQNLLHDANLVGPRFIGYGKCSSVVIVYETA